MKQFFASVLLFAFAVLGLSAQQSDPTLMKINGKNIPLSEFEYIYNKNNTNNVVDKKSLEEYVELFVNFKLKVEEAIAQGLDTTQSFKNELAMYRNQLAEQYLKSDESVSEELLKTLYDRKKEELQVSHILIRIPEGGTANDTTTAYNKAMEIYKRTQKEDFETLARDVSEDPSVSHNGGNIGWISALRTPYTFEDMAYQTPVGKVSMPIRTFIGYHIIKVNDKRQSQGEVKVAHILLLNDRNNPDNNESIQARADSIYNLILAGEDFGELAVKFSQDPGSASQKGELPWFESGRMIPEFESASFALKNKGEVSKPIASQFGWHIIKLIDKKPLAEFDELKKTLENYLLQSDRVQTLPNTFIENLKKEYNFVQDKEALNEIYSLADKYAFADSAFVAEGKKLNKTFLSYAHMQIPQSDFINHLAATGRGFRGIRSDFIDIQLKDYVYNKLIGFEQTQLNRKYPEFRNLMQEYHDGILLFEVMNKEVWEKASQDKEGLSKFFEANKDEYAWTKPHYKGRVILAKDKASLRAAKNILKRANPDSIDTYIQKRLNDSIQYVKVEKGLWIQGENPVIDSKIFKTGKYKPTKEYPYYFVQGKMLKTHPEDYTDVRGVVTANYQDYLEKEWIAALRAKYPVEIDEKVLKTVKKN